jgi:transposase
MDPDLLGGKLNRVLLVNLAVGPLVPRTALRTRQRQGCRAASPKRAARTVQAWEAEILAWHATDGCSNGPTEAVNLLVKKVKRVGHGFGNFANYRLRLLLHRGVRWQTHQVTRLRGHASALVSR